MRFFALALLVAGAYAAGETCADADGASNPATCTAGYEIDAANNAIVIETEVGADAANPSDPAGINTKCCAAKTGNFAGDTNSSDVSSSTQLTFDATPTDVTCKAGYQVANAANNGFQNSYTVALADDGTTITCVPATANAGCAAIPYTGAAVTLAGVPVTDPVTTAIAGTNIAATADYSYAAFPTFACTGNGKVLAAGLTGAFVTDNATTGAGTFTVTDANDVKLAVSAYCVDASYTGAAVTLAGVPVTDPVTTAIAGTNIAATVDYTYGAFPTFACSASDKKLADGITGAFVTDNATTGAGTFTVTDANDVKLAVS